MVSNAHKKVVLVIVALLNGCMGVASIRPDAKTVPGAAYVFGRFRIRTEKSYGEFSAQTMGLKLRCADGKEYTIRFTSDDRVQAIEINPSRCALEKVIYADAAWLVFKPTPPPPEWIHADDFAAGHAYYLGDFFAKGTFSDESMGVTAKLNWTWDMDPDDDSFESTTAELKRTFANLASLPTVDRRLAPRRPPPPPGAQGPPISIERAAVIAQYTKRSYKSPAACEAACPSGRCVPYRGASGTAMACIVRCKVDKDCPDGLACNCAAPEGGACQAIAQAPDDPMEGICLAKVSPAN